MIQANELKIGNWVNFAYQHKKETLYRPCKVAGLDEAGQILVIDRGLRLELRGEAQPIVLTTQILEQCGWEKDYNGYDHESKISFSVTKEGELMGCWQDRAIRIIQHLHQLQNLYFSLTGKELQVNLK